MLLPGSDDGIRIWRNGTPVFKNDVQRGGLPLQDVVFLDLQAGGNDILIRVRNIADEHNLYLHYRSLEGSVKSSLPERLDEAGLAERLKTAAKAPDNADKIPPDLLDVDWKLVARDGDAERGRKLFGADGIGCAKCHSASGGEAVQGGPSLAGTRKRFTVPYLVESILLPDRQVSQLFKATTIVTADGRVHEGLVIGETSDKLELLSRQAERIEIDKSSVEQRKLQDLSPMPSGLVRKPHELQDILAFLLQLD
jgi:putative heme-binding domain-containing protein